MYKNAKGMKKSLFLLLSLLTSVTIMAQENVYEDRTTGLKYQYYTDNEGTKATLVDGKNFSEWRVVIPSTISVAGGVDVDVTAIGEGAFKGNTYIKYVVIGDKIKTIGKDAFSNNSDLQLIDLPNSLESIDNNAFGGCGRLTHVRCNKNTPQEFILKKMPSTLNNNNFATLYVPSPEAKSEYSSLTDWRNIFGDRIYVGDMNFFTTSDGSAYVGASKDNKATLLKGSNNTETPGKIIVKNKVEDGNNVGYDVVCIGSYAFENNNTNPFGSINTLEIQYGVKTICNRAFFNWAGLKSLTLPTSLTTIGESAFQNCGQLELLTLPASLQVIGQNAFVGCGNLKHVWCDVYDASTLSIKNNSFPLKENNPMMTLYVSRQKDNYSAWKAFFGNRIFEGGMEEIPYPSQQNDNFTFVICKGVKDDENRVATLLRCNGIPDNGIVKIPKEINYDSKDYKVIGIDGNAFQKKTTMVELNIPEYVAAIGPKAFDGCSGIVRVVSKAQTQPDFVNVSFNNARYLYVPQNSSYDWPGFVLTMYGEPMIGSDDETGLNFIYSTVSQEAVLTGRNDNYKDPEDLIIKKYIDSNYKVVAVDKEAFKSVSSFNTLTFEESSDSRLVIVGNAFQGCYNLNTIILPSQLSKVYKDAFSGCSNINHIICKSSSPDVFALGAFPSNSLTTLYVPSSNNEWIFNNQIVFDQIEFFKKDNEYYSGKYIGWVKESKGTARIVRGVPNTTIDSLLVSDKIESDVRTYDLGSIGVSAFTNNSKIKKITLPNTLTGIGDKAFSGFTGLKDIEIEAPPFKINSNVFPNNYSVFSLFVPENTTSAYLGKDGWNKFKEENTYEGLKQEGTDLAELYTLVYGDKGKKAKLTKLKIIDEETTIPCEVQTKDGIKLEVRKIALENALSNNTLKKLIIDEGIEIIGENSFKDCKNLSEIKLPSTLTGSDSPIGNNAFNNCPITTIVSGIGEDLKPISSTVFSSGISPTIYVPNQSLIDNYYTKTLGWSDFTKYIAGTKDIWIDGGLTYEYATDTNTAILTKVTIDALDVNNKILIPGTISINNEEYLVTEIRKNVLKYFTDKSQIKEVEVKENIKKIGADAFKDCKNLVDVQLPSSLETISDNAFSGCSSLKTIDLSHLKTIGASAFSGTKLTDLRLDSVETIGSGAFQNISSLKKVWLSSKLTSVGENAFAGCNALSHVNSSVASPSSVMSADVFSLSGESTTNLCTLFVPYASKANYGDPWRQRFTNIIGGDYVDDQSKDGMTYSCYTYKNAGGEEIKSALLTKSSSSSSLASVPGTVTLKKEVTEGVEESTDYTVTDIGKYAFLNRTGITKLELPSSIASIGDKAFYGCSGISEIVSDIEKKADVGLLEFSDDVFDANIYTLAKVYIPSGEQNLEAYQNAGGWKNFKIPFEQGKWLETVDAIGNFKYRYHTAQKIATVMEIVYSGNETNTLTIPSSFKLKESDNISYDVTEVAPTVFTNFDKSAVKTLIIEDGIEFIGENAFKDCRNLTDLRLPSSLNTISNSAFQNCSGLKTIDLPSSLTSIGDYAFSGVSKIEKLTIASTSSVTIGAYAFQNCGSLKKLWLPSTLTSVGEGAFAGCNGITHLISNIENPSSVISPAVFSISSENTANTSTLFVPYESNDNYDNTWETKFSNIVKGDYVDDLSMGGMTYSCYKRVVGGTDEWLAILTKSVSNDGKIQSSVTLDEPVSAGSNEKIYYTVTAIGKHSFLNRSGITKLELPSSIASIGDKAFYGCSGISEIVSDIEKKADVGLLEFSDDVFDTNIYTLAKVYIPSGEQNLEAYKNTNGWKNFKIPFEQGKWLETVDAIGNFKYRYHTAQKIATVMEIVYSGNETNTLTIPSSFKLKESDNISYDVTEVAPTVFTNFDKSAVKTLIIEDGIEFIGENAFKDCRNLTDLRLPSSLKTIGNSAFLNCSSLKKVWLPSKLTSVGENAFAGCNALTHVCIDAVSQPSSYSEFVPENSSAILFVPKDKKSLYEGKEGWQNFAQVYEGHFVDEITPSTPEYKDMTFICVESGVGESMTRCAILTKSKTSTVDVIIPDSVSLDGVNYAVTEIEKSAFSSSSKLKNITIPETVVSIGNEAFVSCTELANITCKVVEPWLMIIGDSAFPVKLTGQKSIGLYVPYSLYERYEFDNFWSRFSVHKGMRIEKKNVEKGLTYEYGEDEDVATLIKAEVLSNTVEIDAIFEGKHVTTIAKDAFSSVYSSNNKNIKKLIVPYLVEFIKEDAFSSCTELEELWLPLSLTEIGAGAFANSKKLKTFYCDLIVVEDKLPELKENVFPASFDSKIEIFIPKGTKSKYQSQAGWAAYSDYYIQGRRETAPAEGDYNTMTFDFLTGEYTATLTNVTELKVDEEGLLVIPDQVSYGGESYTVGSIGSNVFKNIDKSKIKKLKLQKGTKTISDNAFESLSGLQKIWLPSSLTSIGEKAFTGCTNITHVCSDITTPSPINENVFSLNANNTATLFVPVGEMNNYTGGWISKIANIVEGEYVADTDGAMTFACYKVKNEPVEGQPETYTRSAILTKAATSITEALIKDSITFNDEKYAVLSIGKNAFQNCKNLAKLELPSSLKEIGDKAFAGCTGIREIVSDIEGKNLFKISEDVFDTNTYLVAQVNIPESSIDDYKNEVFGGWCKFGANYEVGKWEEVDKDYGYILRYRYHTVKKVASVVEIVYSSNNPKKLIIPNTFKLNEKDEDSYCVTEIALTSDTHFDRAAVDTILIGDSIRTIAAGTFKNCTNLSVLKLPSKLETIGANAFQNCGMLQMIRLPETLKSIGSMAFNGCKLTRVCTETTPEINKDVFSQYSAFLFVPTGTLVKDKIGWGDFARVYDGYYMGESTPNNDKTYIYLKQKNDGRTAILTASNTSDPIPNNVTFDNEQYKVTIIGEATFSGKSLNQEDWKELPESIVKIEKNAFRNCGLKELKLPSKLTTIGNGAFSGNTNLKELVLPSGIEEIGEKAFQNCKTFKQMVLPVSLTTIGDNIFDGCSNLTAVISKVESEEAVSNSIQSVAQAILYVPESTDISSYSGWTFSHKVKGDRQLGNANGLYYAYSTGDKKAILIDVDTEQAGGDITIPSTITLDENKCDVVAIEKDVFVGKTIVKSVIIGENVTTIGANAFKGCSNLRRVELPSTLKLIGENAFAGCDNIAEVVSHNKDNDFIQNNPLSLPNATIYVPDNTQTLYEEADWVFAQIYAGERVEKEWNGLHFACMTEAKEAILVDATDTNILTNDWVDGEIIIPDSIPMGDDSALTYYHVVAIASKAFSGNTDVKLVELPATLTSIDPTAFDGCTNLAEVVSKIDSTDVINSIALSLPNAILYVPDRAKYEGTDWKFAQIWVGDRVKTEKDGMSFICATGDKTAVMIKGSADQLGNSVTIPGAITIKVGEGEDLECKVIAIAANAFKGCTSLKQIWLPATLESIGEKAFDGCNAIDYICSTGGTPLSINKNVFSTYTATLYVPVGALSSYEQNDVWKTFPIRREGYFEGTSTQNGMVFECMTIGEQEKVALLTKAENVAIIEIPATVQLEGVNTTYQVRTICQNAFRNSKNLEKLILPETLKTIEDNAFDQCSKLTVITTKSKTPAELGKDVFASGIYSKVTVYVPNDAEVEAKYKAAEGWKNFTKWAHGEKKTGTVGDMTYDYLVGVGTATLTKTTLNTEKVSIDGTVQFDGVTYTVTAIGANAFQNCSKLKMVWLPATLTSIDKSAFAGKGITYVSSAMTNPCAIDASTFPSTATLFVPDGFKSNYSGWNDKFSYVAEGTFVDVATTDNSMSFDCYTDNGGNKKAILKKYNANASSVEIPGSVNSYTLSIITKQAFANKTSMESLIIPSGVETIEDGTFSSCSKLKWIESKIVNPISIATNVFANNTATLFIPSNKVSDYKAKGWNFLNIFVGEKKETTVDGWTYVYSTGDKKAVLTKVGNVDKNAKINGTFKIGKDEYTVTSVGEAVFKGKSNIEALTIAKSIENIGANAFDGCNKLTSITCEGTTPPALGANAFPSYNVTVNVPKDAVNAYKNHADWKAFGNNILGITTSVEDDPTGSYNILPTTDSATPEVELWNGSDAEGDVVLTEIVTIDGSDYTLTGIAANAYDGNTAITSIVIPGSVNSIGASAFAGCTNLKSITVNRVTPIDLSAVAGVRGAMTRAGSSSSVFEGVNKETCILYVPAESIDAYKQAVGWKDFKNILAIGTTAINGVVVSEGKPFDIYNMQGRKVKANTTTFNGLPSGVYIVNGKKVMVK